MYMNIWFHLTHWFFEDKKKTLHKYLAQGKVFTSLDAIVSSVSSRWSQCAVSDGLTAHGCRSHWPSPKFRVDICSVRIVCQENVCWWSIKAFCIQRYLCDDLSEGLSLPVTSGCLTTMCGVTLFDRWAVKVWTRHMTWTGVRLSSRFLMMLLWTLLDLIFDFDFGELNLNCDFGLMT